MRAHTHTLIHVMTWSAKSAPSICLSAEQTKRTQHGGDDDEDDDDEQMNSSVTVKVNSSVLRGVEERLRFKMS